MPHCCLSRFESLVVLPAAQRKVALRTRNGVLIHACPGSRAVFRSLLPQSHNRGPKKKKIPSTTKCASSCISVQTPNCAKPARLPPPNPVPSPVKIVSTAIPPKRHTPPKCYTFPCIALHTCKPREAAPRNAPCPKASIFLHKLASLNINPTPTNQQSRSNLLVPALDAAMYCCA